MIIENGSALSWMRLSHYPSRLCHSEPFHGIYPKASQALPAIEIDLDGSLFGSVGLARTVIGPAYLLSYRAVPPGVQETAI